MTSAEEIHEMLEVIEEQLMAVPNRTTQVYSMLDIIRDAKATDHPERQIRVALHPGEPNAEDRHVPAARELLRTLELDPRTEEERRADEGPHGRSKYWRTK